MNERPWAILLYERYVQLYGEPIEQPTPGSQAGEQGSSP